MESVLCDYMKRSATTPAKLNYFASSRFESQDECDSVQSSKSSFLTGLGSRSCAACKPHENQPFTIKYKKNSLKSNPNMVIPLFKTIFKASKRV